VRLVDTGTASFGISCCVWEAAEALLDGASIDDAAELSEHLAASVGNVFTVRALDLARAGGRLAANVEETREAIPVLSMVHGEIRAVGAAADIDEAVTAMADYVLLSSRGGGRDGQGEHLRCRSGRRRQRRVAAVASARGRPRRPRAREGARALPHRSERRRATPVPAPRARSSIRPSSEVM